jgi:hypothetical protein
MIAIYFVDFQEIGRRNPKHDAQKIRPVLTKITKRKEEIGRIFQINSSIIKKLILRAKLKFFSRILSPKITSGFSR